MRGQQPEIVIVVDEEGNATLDGVGFQGSECDIMQAIAQDMGEITHHEEKPERRERVVTREQTTKVNLRG